MEIEDVLQLLPAKYRQLVEVFERHASEIHNDLMSELGRVRRNSTKGDDSAHYDVVFAAHADTGFCQPFPELWWDTPVGFVLRSCNEPIAFVGFTYNPMRGQFVIWQVQGVRGKQKVLSPIHFERFLYRSVVVFARYCDVKRVLATPAQLQPWYHRQRFVSKERRALIQSRMRRRYNKTPLKCGFKRKLLFFVCTVGGT